MAPIILAPIILKHKIFSNQENSYLYDLAIGLKNLSPFHENNVRKHLKTLIKAGYTFEKG